jgi:hypothetical protein
VLAVTSLIVISYTMPLAIIVRNQADERARITAERTVQDVARSLIPLAGTGGGLVVENFEDQVELPTNVGILDAAGGLAGSTDFDVEFAASVAVSRQPASRYLASGGW